jgi:hypothetical protein
LLSGAKGPKPPGKSAGRAGGRVFRPGQDSFRKKRRLFWGKTPFFPAAKRRAQIFLNKFSQGKIFLRGTGSLMQFVTGLGRKSGLF